MIHTLDIKDPTQTPIEWLPKVEALKAPRTFEFKPGLNILWGRNGSGKTTVLRLLTLLLHCAQGGRPVVTERSVGDLQGGGRFGGDKTRDFKKGIVLMHDGQGVRHFDPSHAAGLDLGGSQFDDDFFTSGVMNAIFKGSSGETTQHRFEEVLGAIMRGKVPAVEWKVKKAHVNEVWQGYIGLAEHFLAGTAAKGQPTVLLDEPERSYDLNRQVGIWRLLRAYAPTTQFIVASHSLFALKIPDAHYIDMSPPYLDGSLRALGLLAGWSEEKPKPVPLSELPPDRGTADERLAAKKNVAEPAKNARSRTRRPARKGEP